MADPGWGSLPTLAALTLLTIFLDVLDTYPPAMQNVAFHVWLLSCPVCLRCIRPTACPRMGTPHYCLFIPRMIDTWHIFPSFGSWQ